MADPVSSIAGMIGSAFDFMSQATDLRKTRLLLQSGEDDRHEDREWDRRRLEAEHEHRDRAARQRTADRRSETEYQAELKNYPIRDGPGALRSSIEASYPDRGSRPPLVLLLPAGKQVDAVWRGLPHLIERSLRAFEHDNVLAPRLADRSTTWPHQKLIDHDLRDLATIVVVASVLDGVFELRLGGCHLGGAPPVQASRQVVMATLPDPGTWSEAQLELLERTSTNGFSRPEPLDTPRARRQLQKEWATRLAVLVTIAAVDAYHLRHRVGYDEQLGTAAARLSAEFALPLTLPEPRGPLADPVHHLLHTAQRRLDGGDRAGAAELVGQAWAARPVDEVREWHRRLILKLSETPSVVPESVLRDLARPAAAALPPPARRELDENLDVDPQGWWS
jgi:hypothetical protein